MAGLTSLIADVLKEINLLPQLYEQYLVSHERVVISLPDRNYSRSLSFHLFKVISVLLWFSSLHSFRAQL